MSRTVTFGVGGWCEHCDPSHDHPPHNIVEIIDEPDKPRQLDAIGVLATLLVVMGQLPLQDAANAVGLTPQDLVNEATAWAVASEEE